MPLLLVFILVPIIEIALFIQVGGWIGLWPTLAIVILTAVAGTWMIRSQGLQVLGELRNSFDTMRDPTEPLAHGAMILFAGALLLTPGFFTDTVGFLLLVPAFRRAAFSYLRDRITVHHVQTSPPHHEPHRPPMGEVIDGEYEEIGNPRNPGSSGWTRH